MDLVINCRSLMCLYDNICQAHLVKQLYSNKQVVSFPIDHLVVACTKFSSLPVRVLNSVQNK